MPRHVSSYLAAVLLMVAAWPAAAQQPPAPATSRDTMPLPVRPADGAGLPRVAMPDYSGRLLTLQDAITIAQQQSHQARIARATRDAAGYRSQAFSSGQLPQFSLSGVVPQYNRSIISAPQPDGSNLYRLNQQTNANVFLNMSQLLPFTGGSLTVSSSLSRLSSVGSSTSWNSAPVSVSLQQSILRPNTAGWDRREQNVRGTRDQRAYFEAQEDVAITTTDLFFNAYTARVAYSNAVNNAAVNDTLYRLNTGRFQVGRIGENDLLQSELALLRSRSAVDNAQLEYERAMAALRIGLDLPANMAIDLQMSTTVPVYEADSAVAASQALRNRSTVSDVELQDVVARRRVTEARLLTGLGATLRASYGLNQTATSASSAYEDLQDAKQFSLSVSMPLWQWGAHGESVRAARADQDRVAAQSENTMAQLAMEARFAALQLGLARRSVALLAKADTVAGRRFEVAYNRYSISRITIDNLYIAQQEKDQALTQFAEGLRRYWQSHYRLRRATLFDFSEGHPIR